MVSSVKLHSRKADNDDMDQGDEDFGDEEEWTEPDTPAKNSSTVKLAIAKSKGSMSNCGNRQYHLRWMASPQPSS